MMYIIHVPSAVQNVLLFFFFLQICAHVKLHHLHQHVTLLRDYVTCQLKLQSCQFKAFRVMYSTPIPNIWTIWRSTWFILPGKLNSFLSDLFCLSELTKTLLKEQSCFNNNLASKIPPFLKIKALPSAPHIFKYLHWLQWLHCLLLSKLVDLL